MADLGPNKKRIAQLLRKLGPGSTQNERRLAFQHLEQEMRNGFGWSDVGNAVEYQPDDDKYSTAEMKEFAQAARAEGVEAGIKIGLARTQQSNGNNHLVLPSPSEMAEHCRQKLSQLTNDSERKFVNETCPYIRRGIGLTPGRLGFLASIYIKTGGTTE